MIPNAPPATAVMISRSLGDAARKTIRVDSRSAVTVFRTSSPFGLGMFMSSRARSGRNRRIARMHAVPSAQLSISLNPPFWPRSVMSPWRTTGWSSAITRLIMLGGQTSCGQADAELDPIGRTGEGERSVQFGDPGAQRHGAHLAGGELGPVVDAGGVLQAVTVVLDAKQNAVRRLSHRHVDARGLAVSNRIRDRLGEDEVELAGEFRLFFYCFGDHRERNITAPLTPVLVDQLLHLALQDQSW